VHNTIGDRHGTRRSEAHLSTKLVFRPVDRNHVLEPSPRGYRPAAAAPRQSPRPRSTNRTHQDLSSVSTNMAENIATSFWPAPDAPAHQRYLPVIVPKSCQRTKRNRVSLTVNWAAKHKKAFHGNALAYELRCAVVIDRAARTKLIRGCHLRTPPADCTARCLAPS